MIVFGHRQESRGVIDQMKLKDPGDNKITPQLGAVVAVAGLSVVLILAIAVVPAVKNKNKKVDFTEISQKIDSKVDETIENAISKADGTSAVLEEEPEPETSGVQSPDELDFWDAYPEETEDDTETDEEDAEKNDDEVKNGEKNDDKKEEASSGKDKDGKDSKETGDKTDDKGTGDGENVTDESNDGKHTLVVNRDGEEEWVTISQYLPKSDYDYTNLICKDNRMEYYVDGTKVSYVGVDISKYQDYIDFNKVKKDGIDYVMIRLGARGYGTGQIIADEYFFDNIKRAKDAGLDVGVYFSSQAITVEEAQEEAQLVIDSVGEYHLEYPVAFDMGFVDNDTARIEALSKSERTEIALAFLQKITESGFTGCIFGDKEWLIKEVDLSKLTEYDFWLKQEGDLPDYPYKFSMWQYSRKGSVNGISGFVSLNISFVDFAEK